MDRLEAMSVIIAVTETGSFSAASRKLGTPVASVSRKVAELEARLKAELFQRSSRRMTLTASPFLKPVTPSPMAAIVPAAVPRNARLCMGAFSHAVAICGVRCQPQACTPVSLPPDDSF